MSSNETVSSKSCGVTPDWNAVRVYLQRLRPVAEFIEHPYHRDPVIGRQAGLEGLVRQGAGDVALAEHRPAVCQLRQGGGVRRVDRQLLLEQRCRLAVGLGRTGAVRRPVTRRGEVAPDPGLARSYLYGLLEGPRRLGELAPRGELKGAEVRERRAVAVSHSATSAPPPRRHASLRQETAPRFDHTRVVGASSSARRNAASASGSAVSDVEGRRRVVVIGPRIGSQLDRLP